MNDKTPVAAGAQSPGSNRYDNYTDKQLEAMFERAMNREDDAAMDSIEKELNRRKGKS